MNQYSVANTKNVTMIDELLDLDELEKSGPLPFEGSGSTIRNNLRRSQYPDVDHPSQQQLQKFIRQSHAPSDQAGMAALYPQYQALQVPPHQYPPPTVSTIENFQAPSPSPSPQFHNLSNDSPSCLSVAEHINGCPLCSKFYKNDSTIYIIAIIVLVVICILLLKRVLNV